MKEVKVKFVDFWPTFDEDDNNFVRALKAKYKVVVIPSESKESPDILFYSRCGYNRHYDYDCLKIYFTGENDFPDLNECDYAISFYDYQCDGRVLRYPLYMLYEIEQAACPSQIDEKFALNREFCSVVLGNSTCCDPWRLKIIDAVESYKPLAYGGRYRNNVGGPVPEKIPFIANYKFNLALENSIVSGYVTEKIVEPFAAATVPIYWGDEIAKRDFNPESYICVGDYVNLDSFIRELKRIDSSPEDYLKILRAPNRAGETKEMLDRQLEEFLCNIVENPKRRVVKFGEMENRYYRNGNLLPISNNKYVYKLAKLAKPLLKK